MTIELPAAVEAQLKILAIKQGRDLRTLVEEALRQYIEFTAITDLDASDVGGTQMALLDELASLPDWKAGGV